jgi:hypothetical protein
MSPKEEIIQAITNIKLRIDEADFVKSDRKTELFAKLDKATANVPEGSCGSPDVIIAVHVMKDTFTEVLTELLNSFPR